MALEFESLLQQCSRKNIPANRGLRLKPGKGRKTHCVITVHTKSVQKIGWRSCCGIGKPHYDSSVVR